MIGDNGRRAIESTYKSIYTPYAEVSLSGLPLSPYDTPDTNRDLVYTYGRYYVKYSHYNKSGEKAKQLFTIRYDFGKEFIKCNSFKELKQQRETNEIVRFLLDFTTISKELFTIAGHNEQMQIPFCLDFAKYNKYIRKQIGEEDLNEYAMVFNSQRPKTYSKKDKDKETSKE